MTALFILELVDDADAGAVAEVESTVTKWTVTL